MKKKPSCLIVALCLLTSTGLSPEVLAQRQAAPLATNEVAPTVRLAAPQWQPKTRREHETEWQSIRSITNPVTRHVRWVTNSYIELATGLNYRDPSTGWWQPSNPAFRITDRGAESTAGGHTVLLAPDIGTIGSVTVRK